jgi:hypothetical protein
MSTDGVMLIKLLLILGLVLGFGFWQLRSLKKDRD